MNDPTTPKEQLATAGRARYVLRLYIAGMTQQSARAVEHVRRLCDAHLQGCYDLTVVDLYETPERARDQQIICAPTLVKEAPPPPRRLAGDLSDAKRVLLALEIEPGAG